MANRIVGFAGSQLMHERNPLSRTNPAKQLLLEVRRFLRASGVAPTDRLLVGFSGGTDSMALALALAELGYAQVLAHLDHGLRPSSADDARAATAFAERLGVPCVTARLDVGAQARTLRTGLEDAGRRARYAFFAQARVEHHCAWIALGHQADDLTEDVLLRLVRGAGWPALGGMSAVDRERRLLRPLLNVPRQALEAFVHAAGASPVEDESNAEPAFRRNRLRLSVVPLLRAENPGLHRAMGRLHELAELDAEYWEQTLAPILPHIERLPVPPNSASSDSSDSSDSPDASPSSPSLSSGSLTLRIPESILRPLHPAMRLRVYTRMLAMLTEACGHGQARAETLFALDAALLAPQRPKRFELPGGLRCELGKGYLWVSSSHLHF